jgi:Putative Actinobacterial Holin-X, holin superfamily III
MKLRRGWTTLLQGLGQSLLELLRAEVRALTDDLKATGKRLAGSVALFGVAGFFLFWACGVLAYLAVELLALRLSRPAAAGVVLGALLLIAALLAFLGWRKARRLETPAATVRRRMDDSLGWWRQRVFELDEGEDEGGEEPSSRD